MDKSVFNTVINGFHAIGSYAENSASTPNFKALKAAHADLPMNEYLWKRIDGRSKLEPADGWGFDVSDFLAVGLQDPISFVLDHTSAVHPTGGVVHRNMTVSALETQAAIAFREKLDGIEIDLGQILVEAGETAAYILDKARQLANVYRAFRRGMRNIRVADTRRFGRRNMPNGAFPPSHWTYRDVLENLGQEAANLWLETLYAIKPLVADAFAVASQLEEGLKQRPDLVRIHEAQTRDMEADMPSANFWKGHVRARGRVEYVVHARLNSPLWATLDQTGLTNILGMAWEVVPFSFVVDWVFPIGQFLRSIVPPMGWKFIHGYSYVKVHGYLGGGYDRQTYGNRWVTYQHVTSVHKVRKNLSGFPQPKLRDLRLELEQYYTNVQNIITSASLMLQLARS